MNGEKVSFVATGTATGDEQAMAEAINSRTDEHGVTATIDNGVLSVSDNSGADIEIVGFAGGTGSTLGIIPQGYDGFAGDTVTIVTGGADSGRIAGAIQLNSSDTFSTTGTTSVDEVATKVTSALENAADIDIMKDDNREVKQAIANIDSQRAGLGAVQNRFSHTISNLANIAENVSASRSRIQDTDFAVETAHMTKNQILQQAGTSILSQANQVPQAAISLLGG